MRRWIGVIAALVVSMLLAGGPAVAKQNVAVEIFYNGTWNDHTADLDHNNPITINHAAGAEQGGVVPTDGTVRFQSPNGRMNPDNPRGPFFGLINEKTPMRVKVAGDVRISGRAVKWQPRRSLGGGKYVSWVDVTIAGKVRELGQGEAPKRSPLYRSISGIAAGDYVPWAYWPMEDGRDATQFGADTAGLSPMTFGGGVTLAADSELLGAQPLPTFDSTGVAVAVIPTYTNTNKWALQVALKINAKPVSDTVYLTVDSPGGSNVSWRLSIIPVTPAIVTFEGLDSAGVATGTAGTKQLLGGAFGPSESEFFGKWWFYTLTSYIDGGTVWAGLNFSDTVFQQTNAGANGLTVHAAATRVKLFGGNGVSFGHLGFFKDPNFDVISDALDNAAAMNGWDKEKAGDRFLRICREEGIASTLVGTASDTQLMGPQPTETTLKILQEIAKTDAGIIHDTRSQEGLTFRTGRSMYNQ